MNTNHFTTKTADRGDYTVLNDDAPQWLRDAVYEAHRDELPNDWRYDYIAEIWDTIVDMFGDGASTITDMAERMTRDSGDDVFETLSERRVVSSPGLYEWAAYGDRYALVAEAEAECGRFPSAAAAISHAYWSEIRAMCQILTDAVKTATVFA